MKTLLLSLLTIGACFVSMVVSGQTKIIIKGTVVDARQMPVAGATVALLKDSQTVKLAVTEGNGSYLLEGLFSGKYQVTASLIGMKKMLSKPFIIDTGRTVFPLPAMVLETDEQSLNAVTVTAKKNYIEQKIDRTVVNADVLISNAGTTALEVLEKAPGVQVDANGTITLKGTQGVTIYIDNRPTYLLGTDLQNYLRSLPANMISQLEIMSNPPAQYDAAGNGGIINIKTLKQTIKGFNMGINISPRISKYQSLNSGFDLNYRRNKFNFYTNFSYGTRNTFNDVTITRQYMNADGTYKGQFDQNSYIRRTGYGFRSVIGTDYYVSEKTTLGLQLNSVIRFLESINNSSGYMFSNKAAPDSTIVSRNQENGRFQNIGVNLNMRHDFKKDGPAIQTNFDYISYITSGNQEFVNFIHSDGIINTETLTGNLPGRINIIAGKVDYQHPLANQWKLETGAKYSYTSTSNSAEYFNFVNNIAFPDYDKTNHFMYNEQIGAAYINANRQYKHLGIQLGLRFENTISNGHQLGNIQKRDSSFNRNYAGLFPTVFLLYKFDSLEYHQLKFNYGRRIDRPYYQDLNPFVSPLDKFTFYVGNPYLKPSFTTKLELSYIFKNWLTLTTGYSQIQNQVSETIEIVNGRYFSRPGNIGNTKLLNTGLNITLNPFPWLMIQGNNELNAIHSVSDFYSGKLDTRSIYFFSQGLLQFKLKKNWQLQLDGSYQSAFTTAQFAIDPRGRINMGIAKKVSKTTSLKLSANDLFNTNINRGRINNLNQATAAYKTLSDSRALIFTLSMRFGKKIEGQKSHDSSSAEAEQNRVK